MDMTSFELFSVSQSNPNPHQEISTVISSLTGSCLATLLTHPLNNYYSLLSFNGSTLRSVHHNLNGNYLSLLKGMPETIVMRCMSQGGAIAIQTSLSSHGINDLLACSIGGIWDAIICSAIDINNVTKLVNSKISTISEALKLGFRVFPVMASRDIPNLVVGKVWGPKLSSMILEKDVQNLNNFERFSGSFVLTALYQLYAAPMTSITTKMIRDRDMSFLDSFKITVIKEKGQIYQRIGSRMMLVGLRNGIAFTTADSILSYIEKEILSE